MRNDYFIIYDSDTAVYNSKIQTLKYKNMQNVLPITFNDEQIYILSGSLHFSTQKMERYKIAVTYTKFITEKNNCKMNHDNLHIN